MSEEQLDSNREVTVWTDHPSHWMAFKYYFMCALLIALLFAVSGYAYMNQIMPDYWFYPALGVPVVLLFVLGKAWLVRTTNFKLTNQRLTREQGVFTRETEEIELYRVRDWAITKPFFLRLTGRGHVRVVSTDATAPDLYLTGVTNPENVRETLRKHVEQARDKKRVRHVDIDGGSFEP